MFRRIMSPHDSTSSRPPLPRPRLLRSATALAALGAALLGSTPAGAADFPTVAVGPMWGLRAPYQMIGAGAAANVHIPHLVNVFGQAAYGLPASDVKDASPWFFELYAGYPLSWEGEATLAHADNQYSSTSGNTTTTTTEYHNEDTDTAEMLSLEGGIVSGARAFRIAQPDDATTGTAGSYRDVSARLFYVMAGIRYAYAWDDTARNMNVFFVHAMSPALGVPSPGRGESRKVLTGLTQDEATDIAKRPLGVKAGGNLVMWKNAFATLDFEVAYLPGPGTWAFTLGNTFPLWF